MGGGARMVPYLGLVFEEITDVLFERGWESAP